MLSCMLNSSPRAEAQPPSGREHQVLGPSMASDRPVCSHDYGLCARSIM